MILPNFHTQIYIIIILLIMHANAIWKPLFHIL